VLDAFIYFNFTVHFTLLQERRLSIRSKKLSRVSTGFSKGEYLFVVLLKAEKIQFLEGERK